MKSVFLNYLVLVPENSTNMYGFDTSGKDLIDPTLETNKQTFNFGDHENFFEGETKLKIPSEI